MPPTRFLGGNDIFCTDSVYETFVGATQKLIVYFICININTNKMIEIPDICEPIFRKMHKDFVEYIEGPFKSEHPREYQMMAEGNTWYWYNLNLSNIRYISFTDEKRHDINIGDIFRNPDLLLSNTYQ